MSEGASAWVIVWAGVATVVNARMAVRSEKTGAHAWAMLLSVRNVKPWSVPKCHCANWLHKHMVKP